MTISQMADVAGVSPETVRRKVKELCPEKVKNGRQTSLNQEEATKVLADIRKSNFVSPLSSIPTQGEEVPTQIVEVVRQTVVALVPVMVEAFRQAISPSQPLTAKPAALPAPQLATRDELRRIVQDAANDSGDYAGTWRQLYQEIYYRLHVNVRERAKNQGVQALDIVEAEGLLPEAVAVAREIFGGAA